MRLREKTYSDYGLRKLERAIVEDYCTEPGNEEEYIIRHVVHGVNPSIEKELYNSLVHKQSFDQQVEKNYIPIGKKDFYGYRRKAIHELYCIITLLRLEK